MPQDEEVVLALPPLVHPIRHVRSTVILSSVAAVRAAGLEARYLAALAREHHDVVLGAVAGSWVPIDIGTAHYTALDELALSNEMQLDIGRATGNGANLTLIGTGIRMAKSVGVTPWSVLPSFQRFWERGFDGGALGIYRLGPKEARIDVARASLCDIRYFRTALRGLCMSILNLFCAKTYMHERLGPRVPETASYRIQWA